MHTSKQRAQVRLWPVRIYFFLYVSLYVSLLLLVMPLMYAAAAPPRDVEEEAGLAQGKISEEQPRGSSEAPGTGAEAEVALSAEQERLYLATAAQLRCPTCVGLSVLQSEAPFSQQIKEALRERVRAGDSQAALVDFFVERYGLWILRKPPATGSHLLLWLVPLLFLGGVPGALVWSFRRQKKRHMALAKMQVELAALREQGERDDDF